MRVFTVTLVSIAAIIMGLAALIPVMVDNGSERIVAAREAAAEIRLAEVRARTAADVEQQRQRQAQMATREAAWTLVWVGGGFGVLLFLMGIGWAVAGLGLSAAMFGLRGAKVYWEVFGQGAKLTAAPEVLELPASTQWTGKVLTPAQTIMLPVGRDQEKNSIAVPVDGSSVAMLIAGQSGMGKSSLMRAELCALADQQRQGQAVQVAVVNPKQVDLAIPQDSSLLWSPVAISAAEITKLLEMLVTERDQRNGLLAERGADTFLQGGLSPLVVFIDELSDVMEAADRTTKILLLNLIRSGRAAGFFIVAATQSPRASNITGEIKNAARRRIALAMTPEESQLVLGNRAAAGLPMEQGAAIYQDGVPIPIRTFHVEGDEWRRRIEATRTGRRGEIVYPTAPVEPSQDEQIKALLLAGHSMTSIEREVFGVIKGGAAFRKIKQIKEGLGL